MKALVVPVVLVIVLIAAAEGFRRAAAIEDALATADEQLTTNGAASRESEAALDSALDVAGRLPLLGTRLQREVRRNRATQAYWQREYAAFASGPLAPVAGETDSTILLLSANAAFRQAVAREKTAQALSRGLNEVLKDYGAVLDRDPSSIDGAYNYEFVARLRTALASGRMSDAPDGEARNMQGEEGDPPDGAPKDDFKVIVPMRPEERKEQLDPGAAPEIKRKG